MKIEYFSAELIAKLKKDVGTNISMYDEEAAWAAQLAKEGNHIREMGIEVERLPELTLPSKDDTADAENARRLHAALVKLSPLQAMDERIWACLSHTRYWEYMRARWQARTAGAIVDRYMFDGTGFGTLVRNGISRLWWFGHVTWDSKRKDPYELTDVLLCNQDVQQALLQRSFGKSRPVLHAVLDHIKSNRDTIYAEAIGTKVKTKAIELNLLGGVSLLDAMAPRDIQRVLSEGY